MTNRQRDMAKIIKHFFASLRCEGTVKYARIWNCRLLERETNSLTAGCLRTDMQLHPVLPSIVASPLNIRLSGTRFASQFPTNLFLSSPRFQLASASLSLFLWRGWLADALRLRLSTTQRRVHLRPPPNSQVTLKWASSGS
jgi:hypothetical protein